MYKESGLTNVTDGDPAAQVVAGWATTIQAGALSLGNSSGARIVLDATSTAPKILIYDS